MAVHSLGTRVELVQVRSRSSHSYITICFVQVTNKSTNSDINDSSGEEE